MSHPCHPVDTFSSAESCLPFPLKKKNWFKREKCQFVVPLIHALIGWFLYVPWPGIKPTTLAHWVNAPTNWAPGQGPYHSLFKKDLIYFILFILETEKDGRNSGRGTLISCLSCTSWPETEPLTQACALTGNRTGILPLCGTVHNQQSHTGHGNPSLL